MLYIRFECGLDRHGNQQFHVLPQRDGAGGSVKIITGGGSPNQHSYNTGWGAAINQAPKPGTGDYFTTTFPAATRVFVDPSDAGEDFRLLNDTVDAGNATGCKPGKNCLKDGSSPSCALQCRFVWDPKRGGREVGTRSLMNSRQLARTHV